MKKISKLICLIMSLFVVTGAIGLTACGGGSSEGEITVAVMNNSNEVRAANDFKAAYVAKYPDRKVKIVKITNTLDNWIVTQKNANNLPDIIQVYDYSCGYWTANNLFKPISDFMTRDGIDEADYFESILEIAKSGSDGKIYWAPRDYNKTVVAYNKDIFDAANVSYPTDTWTWTDFLNICAQLKSKESQIKAFTGETTFYPIDANLNWEAIYYPAIKSYGGDIIDKDAGTAIKNKTAFVKGITKLLDLADEGISKPPSEDTVPFANLQCAMQFCVRPDIVSYANNLKKPDGTVPMDFAAMPAYDDEEVTTSYIGMGCTGYGITTSCSQENLDFAWDFLKLIITEEGQELFSATGSGFPVLKGMASDPNATYRKYIPGANHDAFSKFPERDLPMNYLAGFKPQAHLDIRQVLTDTMLKGAYRAGADASSKTERDQQRNAFYVQLEDRLNNAIGN